MRQIVIDTETTGLDTKHGHRIIEIGCIELQNRKVTGNNFHYYLNPEREIEAEALEVHGITNDFLTNKPKFADILPSFLTYIENAELIAHNAPFDIGFLNHEIKLISKKAKPVTAYVTVFDTLPLARKMFPGQRNSLDALCKRFKIDLSGRKLHGALLDANLLAEVYLAMTGGQTSLFSKLENFINNDQSETDTAQKFSSKNGRILPVIAASPEELASHQQQLAAIKKSSGKCLWEELNYDDN